MAFDPLLVAMSVRSDCSSSSCPVLLAWSKSEEVLKRLVSKDLLILPTEQLSRDTVVENSELLVPLISLVGSWDRLCMLQDNACC